MNPSAVFISTGHCDKGVHIYNVEVFMKHDNDNKPPEWSLVAELHFFCQHYSGLIKTISDMPQEYKGRCVPYIEAMTHSINTIHDLVEAQNGSMVD